MTIGERIRFERKKAGLTQEQLGKKINVSQAAIGQFESNKANLQMDTIKKIAEGLEIDVELLLSETEILKDAANKIEDGIIGSMRKNILTTFDSLNPFGKQLLNDYCDTLKTYPQLKEEDD